MFLSIYILAWTVGALWVHIYHRLFCTVYMLLIFIKGVYAELWWLVIDFDNWGLQSQIMQFLSPLL